MFRYLFLDRRDKKLKEVTVEEFNLKLVQEKVEGYFEATSFCQDFFYNNISILINEDGKAIYNEKDITLKVMRNNRVVDNVMGSVLFISARNGYEVSLTDEQINLIKRKLSYDEINKCYILNI